MSQDYYVRVPESAAISVGFGAFQQRLEGKFHTTSSNVTNLCSLGSFTGLGAEAIKQYFNEVHLHLIMLFVDAVNELDRVYNLSFHEKLKNASNDAAGEFPSSEMQSVVRDFNDLAKEADKLKEMIRAAENALPAGYSFTKPNIDQFKNPLMEKSTAIKRMRTDSGGVDSAGKQAIDTTTTLSDLMTALNKCLSYCTKGTVSMANYQGGMFQSLTADLKLRELHIAAQDANEKDHDALLAVKKQAAEDRAVYLENEKKAAAEEKNKWAKWGTVLQYVAVGAAVAGAVAAFASGGAVVIAFSLVAVAAQSYNLGQRQKQLKEMKKDPGADIKPDSLSKVLGGAKAAKDPLDDVGKFVRSSRYYDNALTRGPVAKRITEDNLNSAVHFASDTLIDVGADYLDHQYGDDLEGDAKRDYDVSKKVVKKGLSKYVDNKIDDALQTLPSRANPLKPLGKTAGVVGFVSETGQIVTDHYVSENDKVIEKCDAGLEELDAYQKGLEKETSYSWDAKW